MDLIRYGETSNHLVLVVNKDAMGIAVKEFIAEAYTHLEIASKPKDSEGQRVDIVSLIRDVSIEEKLDEPDDLLDDAVHDDIYYLDMVTFEVENTLYLVPRRGFIQETDAFSVLLKNIDTSQPEHDRYLKLEGVDRADLEALLKYMHFQDAQFTSAEWMSILRLATEWKMLDIRAAAIRNLTKHTMDPASQVKFGREFKVADWVRSGLYDLAERQENMSQEDLEKIGFESGTKICTLREEEHDQAWDTYINCLSLDAHGTTSLMPKLTEVFVGSVIHDNDPLEQLLLAKEKNLVGSFAHAFKELCSRKEKLKLEEVERMGTDIAVRIWDARLEMRRAATSLSKAVTFNNSMGESKDDPEKKEEEFKEPAPLSFEIEGIFGCEIAQISREGDNYLKYQRPIALKKRKK